MTSVTAGAEPTAPPAENQTQPEPFETHLFTAPDGRTLPYRLLPPDHIEPGKTYPLVLFLHGAGERGTENERQLLHVARELAAPALRGRFPAYVLAPQCPEGKQWVEVPWGADSHVMPEQPSEPLTLTVQLMQSLFTELPIDTGRVYLTGLSMGGYGVWDLLQRGEVPCAGAVAICGGGDPAFVEKFVNVPVWAFHGDQDTVVKPHRSREMVDAMRAAGGRPVFTEYPGVGHNSWAETARNRLVWDWLFAQSVPQPR